MKNLMPVAEERKLVVDDLLGMPYSNGVINEEGKHQEHRDLNQRKCTKP